MKIYHLMLLLLFIPVFTSGYEVNDTVQIIGEYKVLGVLTNCSSYIDVTTPQGILDIDNASMAFLSTGRYYYDYNVTQEGLYETTVRFYVNGSYMGNDTGNFVVGDYNKLKIGVCPTGTLGVVGMWVLLGFLLLLSIIGISLRYPILTGFSGFFLIIMGIITWGCGDIITYFSVIIGLVFLIIALNVKSM